MSVVAVVWRKAWARASWCGAAVCGAVLLGVILDGVIFHGAIFHSAARAAFGVQTEEAGFRELVRRYVTSQSPEKPSEPLPGLPRDVKKSIALEYAVLLHKDGKDEAVDAASHEFHRGDQLRVRVLPLNDLYIYVFYERKGGQRLCLQPLSKEAPPLARHNRAFELPADGSVYELDNASGEEKLLLVATSAPSEDLAALADMVCKKSDEMLTAQEKVRRDALQARSQKVLDHLREEQSESAQYRGLLSEQALTKIGADAQRQGNIQAVLVEPPHDKQTSTFCMASSLRSENEPELFVTISLKTAPIAAKP